MSHIYHKYLFICAFILCSFLFLINPIFASEMDSSNESSSVNVSEKSSLTNSSTQYNDLLPGEALLVDTQVANLGLTAPSCILMEASTGTIIYETDSNSRRSPASITKIMTLLLIFDALEEGKIKLDDQVVTSAYAKSMGGSQVFLEEGEVQTVETLIKCIVVASGNDASVTMAEYIAGSETEFVRQMNERAKKLGMENTNFEDCCGLSDSDNHYSSAKDVAIMSRELITKYPQIYQYSTIWMENITHTTKQGSSEFCLSSTNKLLKMNTSFTTTGLKTGSTSKSKYCLSATAEKDGIELIAVIMACPNYKDRFSEAASLLNFGYASCKLYEDKKTLELSPVPIANGVEDTVLVEYESSFSYLSTTGEDFSSIERQIIIDETLSAPISQGQIVGYIVYRLNETEIGRINILASNSVEKAKYHNYFIKLLKQFII